jgi:hypothetical protein
MTKARSPSYPSIGLGTAIEKVTAVYHKDVQNSIPRAVVAKHAGYGSLNGNALSMLASLLKYGLLTGRGDNTSVSDLALQIIAHPVGSPERQAAIREAAFSPGLFAEIRDYFKGAKVSDDALRAYLLTRKFLPSAVAGVIRAYRETMALVEAESAGYSGPGDEKKTSGSQEVPVINPSTGGSAFGKRPIPPPPAGEEPYRVSITADGLEVVAKLNDVASIDKLIAILKAGKGLITPVEGAFDTGSDEDGSED